MGVGQVCGGEKNQEKKETRKKKKGKRMDAIKFGKIIYKKKLQLTNVTTIFSQ